MASERRIKGMILRRLGRRPGLLLWSHPTGSGLTPDGKRRMRYGLPGAPDIIGVYRGRAVGIECKAERGRQSDQQRRFQAAFESCGGVYIIARSPEEAEAGLDAATSLD